MAIVERTCFQRTASSRQVKRFTTTPQHDGHRSGNRSAVRCANPRRRRYVRASSSCPRRGPALREAPSREANRSTEPKFNLNRVGGPNLHVAPPWPRKRQTPARSASHGERDAQPAAEPARVVTIHVYTRLEKPAPDARPDDAPRRAADARRPYETKRAVRYLRAASLVV